MSDNHGARLTARHTQAELDRFDALSFDAKCNIYKELGQEKFDLMYGAERTPVLRLKTTAAPLRRDTRYKDGNPKTELGIVKPTDFYTPPIPYYEYSLAHMQGAFKYGPFNWRDDAVSISTYLDAAKRHIDLFKAGEQRASDTGIHHLAHAMTCLSIVIDAEAHNTLIDDRFTYRDNNGQEKSYEILNRYIDDAAPRVKGIYDKWYGYADRKKAEREAREKR